MTVASFTGLERCRFVSAAKRISVFTPRKDMGTRGTLDMAGTDLPGVSWLWCRSGVCGGVSANIGEFFICISTTRRLVRLSYKYQGHTRNYDKLSGTE